jgi:hypothetical protein
MSFVSFPSFGSIVIADSKCAGGSLPTQRLYFHASRIIGPVKDQYFLYTEYGIPSGPGAESLQVDRASYSSLIGNSLSMVF